MELGSPGSCLASTMDSSVYLEKSFTFHSVKFPYLWYRHNKITCPMISQNFVCERWWVFKDLSKGYPLEIK